MVEPGHATVQTSYSSSLCDAQEQSLLQSDLAHTIVTIISIRPKCESQTKALVLLSVGY